MRNENFGDASVMHLARIGDASTELVTLAEQCIAVGVASVDAVVSHLSACKCLNFMVNDASDADDAFTACSHAPATAGLGSSRTSLTCGLCAAHLVCRQSPLELLKCCRYA